MYKSVASQVQYGILENLSNLLSAYGLCTLEAREREWLTVQEHGTVFLYFASAPCEIRLTSSLQRFNISFMVDKYFYKREKVANLIFDLVKYLLTALGATLLFTDKEISTGIILIIAALAILVFAIGIFITPKKEA